ncbi:FAD-NAD(P)-binding protein [Leucobacter luti]|uniref:FAD/NAD(P)-binding protein n=1 Tax=Leucobacter luti TaxID=340320 RepID=UPI00104BD21A|nr:FAD/NAD(P)-binding protein [Leucobacter luti]MCW2289627.1 hypothetical protein [Leucobacter luti]TCK37798.1 FAD-NAD(P)-binding protein [Leucobacter luti]
MSAPIRIACIGAGPAAVMLLERITANHQAMAPGAQIEAHLIDPHRPGGGRIWRREQSPLLKLNSMLEDVAFFTDASCQLAGPVAPGPSFADWVRGVRRGEYPYPIGTDAVLDRELATIGARDFPTRRLNNAYLSWAFHETLRRAGDTLQVTWHRDTATAVAGDGPFRIQLESGEHLAADLIVYAVGHNGTETSSESRALAGFAADHGLNYVAPAFTADVDLDHVPAGSDVIVRGMGLAAVDLVVLLTEGRGGRFVAGDGGALRYLPSGREPVLHLGSRRGVPYRSKITSQLAGDPVTLEYLGAAFHAGLADREVRGELLDFEGDAWPLIAAELVTGYYRELFTGHPERVAVSWERFAPLLHAELAAKRGWDSPGLADLVRAHVPDPADRFELEAFDRPLSRVADGGTVPGTGPGGVPGSGLGGVPGSVPSDAVNDRVRAHIGSDLRDRTTQAGSATQGLFLTALHVYLSLAEVPASAWNAESRTRALPGRWHTFFSYIASGPPGHRLEELLALADAGVVRFLGADVQLAADVTRGVFTASGSAVVADEPGAGESGAGAARGARAQVSARTLIDAWLPQSRAAESDNPLLRHLVTSGRVREVAVPGGEGTQATTGRLEAALDGSLVGAPRQFALGPFVEGPTGGAFTRPGLNSLPFRVHDRCARAILVAAAGLRAAELAADPAPALAAMVRL